MKFLNALAVLHKYWGHQSFRSPQAEIIDDVMANKDVLAVLPTGAGKSICFQVPALLKSGVTVVISPLIALMNDQVQHLNNKGITAYSLHSGITLSKQEDIIGQAQKGETMILYLSPEKLNSDWFQDRLSGLKINLFAIDEAHCISQWGYDFRPEYLKIVASLQKYDCPKIALTATANSKVKDDICSKLNLKNVSIYNTGVFRKNLVYQTIQSDDKENVLRRVVKSLNGCSILYVRSRKMCHYLGQELHRVGVSNVVYHAGLTKEQRNKSQETWMNNKVSVIVATNAFGMGVDKPDVRNVIHFGAPESLEAYYQEAGRAGRDGKIAYAILVSGQNDKALAIKQVETAYQPEQNILQVFQALCNKLQVAEGYLLEGFHLLDLSNICHRTKLDQVQVHYSLRALDLSGIIQYQQDYNTPTRIEFLISPERLFSFYDKNKILENVIKSMVRLYGAQIYENSIVVNTASIARMAQVSLSKLDSVLSYLKERNIIRWFKGTDEPVVKFLIPRPAQKSLKLDKQLLHFLKDRSLNQLKEMYSYITFEDCKQKFLGSYFDQKKLENCGVCISCQSQNESFEKSIIDFFTGNQSKTLDQIKNEMPSVSYHQLSKMLVKLINEQQLVKFPDDSFGLK